VVKVERALPKISLDVTLKEAGMPTVARVGGEADKVMVEAQAVVCRTVIPVKVVSVTVTGVVEEDPLGMVVGTEPNTAVYMPMAEGCQEIT
jgi:hypothetical protein